MEKQEGSKKCSHGVLTMNNPPSYWFVEHKNGEDILGGQEPFGVKPAIFITPYGYKPGHHFKKLHETGDDYEV